MLSNTPSLCYPVMSTSTPSSLPPPTPRTPSSHNPLLITIIAVVTPSVCQPTQPNNQEDKLLIVMFSPPTSCRHRHAFDFPVFSLEEAASLIIAVAHDFRGVEPV
ncbi:hypothetical protein CC80DRAFT_168729 [Byssothecium circinans]|uniref:Uncharacterized protein n=1 Tax=Byssothecium circinans TaxID=147558 RepID=A0A6A5TKJ9_9PLEO|nr:hypothetical protein CC80DRAFT_168729 [Byssothecium circinans]